LAQSWQRRTSKLRVGLTGGIGSGKNAVAAFFSDFGAVIIDADVLARDVVAPGTGGLAEIARFWPETIVDGALDRAKLSAVVFSDPNARETLQAIIHPRVRARAADMEAQAPENAIVVHMIPLLFEGDYYKQCDANVLVYAPIEMRIARVMKRDGLTRAEIEARMDAQVDQEKARKLADYIIENDEDFGVLNQRSSDVYGALSMFRQKPGERT